MTTRINPLIKGLITGSLMLGFVSWIFLSNRPAQSGFEYIRFGIYAAGIAWTLIAYSRSPNYTGKFGDIFGQGFRCFVVVTLMMAIFIMIFSMTHPEMANDSAVYFREELVKGRNRTVPQMEEDVASYKRQFTTKLVSGTVFGNLIAGALFTAFGAGLLISRRK